MENTDAQKLTSLVMLTFFAFAKGIASEKEFVNAMKEIAKHLTFDDQKEREQIVFKNSNDFLAEKQNIPFCVGGVIHKDDSPVVIREKIDLSLLQKITAIDC